MTPKKNPKANLENKRGFFFLFGLALSLVLAITAFQYKSEIPYIRQQEQDMVKVHEEAIPITVVERKMPEKPKVEKPKPFENDPYYKEEDDKTKLNTDIKDLFGEDDPGDEPVEIAAPDDEVGEALPPAVLQHIARPMKCEHFRSRDEQMQCLNDWIQEYIKKNTRYPREGYDLNLTDKVLVNFVISTDGEIEKATVVRGKYEVLNEEAIRVVKSIPTFVPAKQMGRKVRMSMTVPVNFRLR